MFRLFELPASLRIHPGAIDPTQKYLKENSTRPVHSAGCPAFKAGGNFQLFTAFTALSSKPLPSGRVTFTDE